MLEIKSFIFGPFQTNTYVVNDGNRIFLVDPACSNEYDRKLLQTYIEDQQSAIRNQKLSIIATHGHLDHLWGAAWATKHWNTSVLIHEADIPMVKAMQDQYNLFGIRATAEPFPIEEIKNLQAKISNVSILSTPGHTPGSVCLYWPQEQTLLSGDTLFCMGYGRTDLPGGSMAQLIRSLDQLMSLPGETRVYPGHGTTTTIAEERR